MKQSLVILLGCLWSMPLQAQPEKLVGTTCVDGTNAYGCKSLSDSLIQFYGASYHCKGQAINAQIEPDGGLAVMGKDISPSKPFKSTIFSAQPWYTPRYDDVSDKLTDLERINIELLNSR